MLFKDLESYCENHTHHPDEVLVELERQTHLQTIAPQMISGKMQGRLLSLISKLLKPQYILEIGTFTSYSALCLAEGLDPTGELHTIEITEDYRHIVELTASKSKHFSKIHYHYGDALKIITNLNYPWDLVFLDAAKSKYLNFITILEGILKPGAVLIADNVLWYGKVVELEKDEDTRILDSFNKHLRDSKQWETQILALRDGLSISIKQEV